MRNHSQTHTKCPFFQKLKVNPPESNYPFQFEEDSTQFDHKRNQSFQKGQVQKNNLYFLEHTRRQAQLPKQKKFIPETVTMNGCHYQRVDNYKANLDDDQVKAQCMACNTQQMIPKNSTKFSCFKCKTLCICKQSQKSHRQSKQKQSTQNNVKLFSCGSCKAKVKYLAGTSQFIRCSKCKTINFVSE